MEITLTKRWIEHKTRTTTAEIKEFDTVEYYSINNSNVEHPIEGTILKYTEDYPVHGGKFFIRWNDGIEDTVLDGSKRSFDILKNCGFTNK